MLLAEVEGTTILFLAGLVLTCGVLLLRTHRQLGSRAKTSLPAPASFSQPKTPPPTGHRLEAPTDVRRWEVEMHDVARDLQAQLDSKIAIVQQLIAAAAQQSDRLEVLLERAADLQAVPTQREGSPLNDDSSHHLRVDGVVTKAGSSASRRHAEIYSLADAGLSSAAIASRVGSPIGEVELILGLRKNEGAAG